MFNENESHRSSDMEILNLAVVNSKEKEVGWKKSIDKIPITTLGHKIKVQRSD